MSMGSKSPKNENQNPNFTLLKSPSTKKNPKSGFKNPNPNPFLPKICVSPKNRIIERKFVVAKRNNGKKNENLKNLAKSECNCEKVGNKCLCLAYQSLRASQEDFFKPREIEGFENNEDFLAHKGKIGVFEKNDQILAEKENLGNYGKIKNFEKNDEFLAENVNLRNKGKFDVFEKNDDFLVEKGSLRKEHKIDIFGKNVKKGSIEKNVKNSTSLEIVKENVKVMRLVKAFEGLKTEEFYSNQNGFESSDKKGVKLGLSSSSVDTSQGSFTFSSTGSYAGRRSKRNSIDSTGTFARRRWRKQQQLKSTRQQPFKLLTEQRGRTKEEEFSKKMQEMMIEEQKQRIPIAQGLPWTTDEPENLVKPPVKEITIPVDLVMRTDVRAVDRADFDQQLAEKEALIEQMRMERERQKKIAEEEEIRRLRKELIPKAQPMPYFDRPFIPRRSEKHPTIPREPVFHIPHHKKTKSCSSNDDYSS